MTGTGYGGTVWDVLLNAVHKSLPAMGRPVPFPSSTMASGMTNAQPPIIQGPGVASLPSTRDTMPQPGEIALKVVPLLCHVLRGQKEGQGVGLGVYSLLLMMDSSSTLAPSTRQMNHGAPRLQHIVGNGDIAEVVMHPCKHQNVA